MNSGPQYVSFLPDFCGTRIVFVVILVAELLAIVLTAGQLPEVTNLSFKLALYSLFIQWIALGCVTALCVCRPYLNHLQDHWVATISYIITLSVSFIITEVAWWLIRQWPVEDQYNQYGHGLFLARSMGISAIACALALRYFYVQHQWRQRMRSEAEARYQALQSRIRPHFLFNCMNTIASLIRRHPVLAEEAVEDLADLFRVSLGDARQSYTLEDEIEVCKRYLRIEKHRLGTRLDVDWQINSLPKDIKIPALSLQPLLENAIYHGIEELPDGGTIKVLGEVHKKNIRIRIGNPVAESSTSKNYRHGNHLAQNNINQRLESLYNTVDPLQIRADDGYYQVVLTIPYPYENIDRR